MIEKINTTVYRCTCELPDCLKSWKSFDANPERCRWCGRRTWNGVDSRNIHLITVNGKTQSITAWSKESGLSKSTITARLSKLWTPEDAVTIPAGQMPTKKRG